MSGPIATTSSSSTGSMMLAINEKKTVPIDLYSPLRQYIAVQYSEGEARNLEDDLDSLRQMRSDLETPPPSSTPTARRDLLQSYFRALCAVSARFPISPDRDHVNTVTFTWCDVVKPSKKVSLQNVQLEKAAVLFNLGSVYSQIALSSDRSTAAGLKQACISFQAAAGAFGYLRNDALIRASVGSSTTVDLSSECAGMFESLMLAQAQECFVEKVIADGKPPGLCSKVARQVSVYYEETYKNLSSPSLVHYFDRTWICHVQMKAAQFYAEACHRAGMELHEKENIAEEIARLKAGISAITDAKKSAKGVAASLLEACLILERNINHDLERAQKENDRVYLMRVPAPNSLAPLPAVSLVKPVAMGEIFDASKEKLFASLVPDGSAKALSRYTEMVDDIIRTQVEKLQQDSEIARVTLKEMDLPESILAMEGNFSLPMDIKESVEDVLVVGGPSGFEAELQQLRDLRRADQELLVETEEMLQKEEREDAYCRTQFGSKFTRPQSSTLTKNLKDRLNKLAANLKQASDSDARIEHSLKDNAALMSILDIRPIESILPSLARPIMSLDGNEDEIVGDLKKSLGQLEKLGADRASLEDMLKDMRGKDDILPKLMGTTGSCEDLFRKEISKYDAICEEITKNIEAQEQLLLLIQAQNKSFVAIFNLQDYGVSRDKCYKQIAAAVAKFHEIKENINEASKFYVTLQETLKNVKQHCSGFVMTRNMERRDLIERLQTQIAGLSFQPDGKAAYNYPSGEQPSSFGSMFLQSDPSIASQPPASHNPSLEQSNCPVNVPQQVDPQSLPHLPGYNYIPAGLLGTHGNVPPQVDPGSASRPPAYHYPSSVQPNAPVNVPQQVDPRTMPQPPSYNCSLGGPPNPHDSISPQVDPGSASRPPAYHYPSTVHPNAPVIVPQQVDPGSASRSPAYHHHSSVQPNAPVNVLQQVDPRTMPQPPGYNCFLGEPPNPHGSISPQVDPGSASRPPAYHYPSTVHPNAPVIVPQQVDPRSMQQPPSYNCSLGGPPNSRVSISPQVDPGSASQPPSDSYLSARQPNPSVNISQQVDPRSMQQAPGYNYPPAGLPNSHGNMPPQIDHQITSQPPAYHYFSSRQPHAPVNDPSQVDPRSMPQPPGYNYPPGGQPTPRDSMSPQVDSGNASRPTAYSYPSAGQPNPSVNVSRQVDPRSMPPAPGYNYPPAPPPNPYGNMAPQVDHWNASQPPAYSYLSSRQPNAPVNATQQAGPWNMSQAPGHNYPPAGPPNPHGNMSQQVDRQTASQPPNNSYPSARQPNAPQQVDPRNMPHLSYTPPPYQQPQAEQARSGLAQPYPTYGSQQPRYSVPNTGGSYPPPLQSPSHEYGRPSYPGLQGQNYNAPLQQSHQSGSHPRPPYAPAPYSSQQGAYYNPT